MLKIILGFWCGLELPKIPWVDMRILQYILREAWLPNIGDGQTVQLVIPEGGIPKDARLTFDERPRHLPPLPQDVVVIFSDRLENIEEYPTMTVLKEGGTRGTRQPASEPLRKQAAVTQEGDSLAQTRPSHLSGT